MTSLRARLYRLHWEARSLGPGFGLTTALRFLERSQRWDPTRLRALRDEKLVKVVHRAWAESPHYRAMMEEQGVRPEDVRGLDDLPKLPVLTKEILRRHADALRMRGETKLEVGATGGTTGEPIRLVRDRAGTVWQRGCYWRGLGWGGLSLGEPFVQLFGGTLGVSSKRRLDRTKSGFSGRHFLPAFELGRENVGLYLEAIRRSGARFLIGYTSAIHLLAQYAERSGAGVALEAVFPTAEPLPEAWREVIARVFGAKVLPYYGCGEIQSLGYACPETGGTIYHGCDEHSVLEVEQAGGGATLHGEGAFLVTDLDNLGMPLLRYRNGDAGVLAPPGCACGRTLTRIDRVDGRVNDVLYDVSGNAISGAIGPHAFKLVSGVEQFQIVQSRIGQVAIQVVRAPGYDAGTEEPKIVKVFRQHLGAAADVAIRYVDWIPRTPAGKARFIINEIGPR